MRLKYLLIPLLVIVALVAAYFAIVTHWSYASGDRAGWVQKLSRKGWVCKTWEGELVMVSMPGAVAEKFAFTIWDENVAEQLRGAIGKRVDLHYEQRVGLPTSCFGETRYYITSFTLNNEGATPGLNVPMPTPATPSTPTTTPITPAVPAASAP